MQSVVSRCNNFSALMILWISLFSLLLHFTEGQNNDPVLNRVPPEQRFTSSFNRWKAPNAHGASRVVEGAHKPDGAYRVTEGGQRGAQGANGVIELANRGLGGANGGVEGARRGFEGANMGAEKVNVVPLETRRTPREGDSRFGGGGNIVDTGQNKGPVYRVNSGNEVRHDPYVNQNGRGWATQPPWNSWGQSSSAIPFTGSPPTAAPKVPLEAKKEVIWFEDTMNFGLKASSDLKFKIRYAPIISPGSPWPMPQTYKPKYTVFSINPHTFNLDVDFKICPIQWKKDYACYKNTMSTLANRSSLVPVKFNIVGRSCDQIVSNVERLKRNMFGNTEELNEESENTASDSMIELKYLQISVTKPCVKYPHLNMSESYDLDVTEKGAVLRADEVWGALRGMETFSQIVYQLEDDERFYVNETYIRDFPRFKHRGLLLDTARHYIDKSLLIQNLEAMAQNKLNVFHWHIVDDQSFPFESKTYPNLTKMGAFNSRTHIYTHEDVEEIIEAARLLGIRVIPEFDTPGHTFSWGYAMNHLLTPCYMGEYPTGLYGPINPILKKNYRFLEGLFKEVASVFKDQFLHIGGDEVPLDCWYSNPTIRNFMKKNNILDMREIVSMYAKELQKILEGIGKERKSGLSSIVWQEMFENRIELKKENSIVQVWSGDSYLMQQISRAGLPFIFSTCWYLDYISYGQDWDKYYRCDQINMDPTDYRVNGTSNLIGGEVCLWMEYVDDSVLMPRLWPRASAAAERLWSDRTLQDFLKAGPRLETQRCRMLARGLPVGVASGPGHCPRHQSDKRKSQQSSSSPSKDRPIVKDSLPNVSQEQVYSKSSMKGSVSFAYLFSAILILVLVFALARQACGHRVLQVVPLSGGGSKRRLVFIFSIFLTVWLIVWTFPTSNQEIAKPSTPIR